MAEATFASSINETLDCMGSMHGGESEYLNIGSKILESELLIDSMYKVFISLMPSNGWVGVNSRLTERIEDVGHAYLNGLYMACTPRIILSGQVDLLNDRIPDYSSYVIEHQNGFCAVATRRANFPRGIVAPTGGDRIAVTMFYEDRRNDNSREDRRVGADGALRFATRFAVVKPNGVIVPSIDTRFPHDPMRAGIFCRMGALSINACADASHLWNVETGEKILGSTKTPLILGCSSEHVKSLFYARTAPLNASGRKHAILHWVRSHQRRLKVGIDVDISKHLRGVTEFEMEGFDFRITSPCKGMKNARAA